MFFKLDEEHIVLKCTRDANLAMPQRGVCINMSIIQQSAISYSTYTKTNVKLSEKYYTLMIKDLG